MGDKVEILGIKDKKDTTVTGVEMFRKLMDEGQAGDNGPAASRDWRGHRARQVVMKPG